MLPLDELDEAVTLFGLQVFGLLMMFLFFSCGSLFYTMVVQRCRVNLSQFMLWGSIINLILANYLPVTVGVFITMVGMRWDEEEGTE